MTEGLDHLSLEKSDRAGTPQPREQMVRGGSCQWGKYLMGEQREDGAISSCAQSLDQRNQHKLKCRQFPLNIRKKFLPSPGTGRLRSHHPWRKDVLTWSWATGPSWPCFSWKAGKDHLQQLFYLQPSFSSSVKDISNKIKQFFQMICLYTAKREGTCNWQLKYVSSLKGFSVNRAWLGERWNPRFKKLLPKIILKWKIGLGVFILETTAVCWYLFNKKWNKRYLKNYSN